MKAISSQPPSVPAAIVRECSEGQRSALARLLNSRSAPDSSVKNVPLVVLSRGLDASDGQVASHAGLAKSSTNSSHRVVADAGHEIHLFTPSSVVQAIHDVSTAVRQTSRLTKR